MALSFLVSDYSFLQLLTDEVKDPTACAPGQNLCLPVLYLKDLKFQLVAYVDGDDKTWFQKIVDDSLNEVKIGVSNSTCDAGLPLTPASPINYVATWQKIVEGVDPLPDIWVGNFHHNNNQDGWDTDDSGWGKVPVGSCFNLNIYRTFVADDENQTEKIGCFATCLQRIPDSCDTSVITYGCNEDAFQFYYNGDNWNSVRLPFYLHQMQLTSEEKSYQKSDGSSIKLFERINEEYEMKIDYMRKEWHMRLKVALAHDTIYIDNLNETGNGATMQVICKEKYEIQWPDFKYKLAPAKTKVIRAEPVHLLNSNCK